MVCKFCPQSHLAHLFYTHSSPCREFLDNLLVFVRHSLDDDNISDDELYQSLLSSAYLQGDLSNVIDLDTVMSPEFFTDNRHNISRIYVMAANRHGSYVHDYLHSVINIDPDSDDLQVLVDTLTTGQGPTWGMSMLVNGLCCALASTALVEVFSSC